MRRISLRLGLIIVALLSSGASPLAASAQALDLTPPITAARFSLTINGVEIASFSQLYSITTEVQPVEILPGQDSALLLKKLPGKRKPPTLTLKRVKNSSTVLWTWHQAVLNGQPARKNASLIMYSTDGTPVARYHLEMAWPSKIEIGALKAGSSEVLMETVTLTAQAIQRVSI